MVRSIVSTVILEDYTNGMHVKQILAKHNITIYCFYKLLKITNTPVRQRRYEFEEASDPDEKNLKFFIDDLNKRDGKYSYTD